MLVQVGESINAPKDLAIINYAKALGAIIIASVHEFASNRSVYPIEVMVISLPS